jgi:hypothetical protein
MVAIDEVHLFVHFALSFRESFAALKPVLFYRLHAPSSTSPCVPILLMSATVTMRILTDAKSLIGFAVQERHWPSPADMRHRNINLTVAYNDRDITGVFRLDLTGFIVDIAQEKVGGLDGGVDTSCPSTALSTDYRST